MVQGAFPGGSRFARSSSAVRETSSIAPTQLDAGAAIDHLGDDPSLPIEAASDAVEPFDQSVPSPMSFELYEDELKSDLHGNEDPYAREHTLEFRSPEVLEDHSATLQTAMPIGGFEVTQPDFEQTVADVRTEAIDEHSPVQHGAPSESHGDSLTSLASLLDDQGTDQHLASETIAANTNANDPWEEPLPAWDYSQNEWPVLVGPHRRSYKSLKATLVIGVLLGLAVAVYILIHQPAAKQQWAITPAEPSTVERVAAATEPRVATAKPVESESQNKAPADAPPSPEAKSAPATEDANAHGKFSLQAAAFPTQAGADEFADKLRTAGVPSYIVKSNLGKRGTWSRVRVGRFNTAEDAQKFAAEAQLRGKTVGMSLQLMVCQYEQP